ncbi:uncharacterized protein K444DRAFT_626797 [Hyaloscypha bicolor E]|uniref:Uncharacterized protein n=1 Tax=Hyaloscypha bicolor E TaxID=1095630 RepID=A0A2J6TK84_9HELO|nr:uncharacterized protein K444DRAFT_626797 [Hyaloscypha bicolor E]PMD63433.1 hypothetical protein K444DRAFT_626797 [Hyaloscypha bicolor E]
MCKIIDGMTQLKCKDSADVAQLRVEGRGGRGERLRQVSDFVFVVAEVRGEFALAPVVRLVRVNCPVHALLVLFYGRTKYLQTATKKGADKGEKARRRRNGRVEVGSSRVERNKEREWLYDQERTNEGPEGRVAAAEAESSRVGVGCNGRSGQAKQAIERMISDAQAETRSLIGGVAVQEVEKLMQKRCNVTGEEELPQRRRGGRTEKRVSGPERDSAGKRTVAAQRSGVNGAAGEKCWGVLLAAFAQVQIVPRTKRQTASATGLDVSSRPLFRRILILSLVPYAPWKAWGRGFWQVEPRCVPALHC